jgi:hypothetical protein
VWRVEQSGVVVLDSHARLRGVGFLLLLVECRHRILDKLRMLHQIVFDDAFDLLPLIVRKGLCRRRKRQERRGREQ